MARLGVATIDLILDGWLSKSVEKLHWEKSIEEKKLQKHTRKEKLHATWKGFQQKYRSERVERVKPIGFAMDGKTYLFYCLEKVVAELSLNMEDDTNLAEQFAIFRRDFSFIRYNAVEESDEIKRSVAFIRTLLRKFEEMGQTTTALELTPYLEVCIDLLQCEDLFELNMNVLFRGDQGETTFVAAPLLAEAFLHSLEMIKKEGMATLYRIEKELIPYHKEEQNHFLYSKALHQLLIVKRKQLTGWLENFSETCPIAIGKKRNDILLLRDIVEPLCDGFTYSEKSRSFADVQMYADILEKVLQNLETKGVREEEKFDLDDALKICNKKFDFVTGEISLGQFRKMVSFHKEAFRWHCAINSDLTAYAGNIEIISIALHNWVGKGERLLRKLLEKTPPPSEEKTRSETAKLSVDQLVEEIGEVSPAKKKREKNSPPKNKRQKGKIKATAAAENIINCEEEKTSELVALPAIVPAPATEREKSIAAVEAILYNSSATFDEKIAARQARMYLIDLLAIEGHAEKRGIKELQVIDLAMKVQASYCYLEQLLRLKNLQQRVDKTDRYAFHNLQHQAMPLGQENVPIISELRMANAWVPDTYLQMARWNELSQFRHRHPPNVLQSLYIAHESGSASEWQKIPSLQETLTVSSLLFPDDEKKVSCEKVVDFSLPKRKAPLHKMVNEIAATIKVAAAETADSYLKSTLTQLSKNLLFANCLMQRLNGKKSPSDSFSLTIRQALYWQGQSMEKALYALLYKERGEEWKRCHSLHAMYGELFSKKSMRYGSLKKKWHNWNNNCRYPYEESSPQNWLHETILAAEIMRSSPHLEEGYIQKSNIAIPCELLSANLITKRVAESCGELIALFVEELLPRLAR